MKQSFVLALVIIIGIALAAALIMYASQQEQESSEPEFSVNLLSFSSAGKAGESMKIFWIVNSESTIAIQHTAIHYGKESVPNPKAPTDYPSLTEIQSGSIPGTFSTELAFPEEGAYYFRAHAIINGQHFWSDEKTVLVSGTSEQEQQGSQEQPAQGQEQPSSQPSSVKEYNIEGDDSAYYMNGEKITELKVGKNSRIKITFTTRTSNVYYGGLDFRSSKFKSPQVKPGDSWTTEEIEVTSGFDVSSYWPSSGVFKAKLSVAVI